ncbi:general stress protein [Brachybacterium sp. GPGPB12]|uniref:general stress protein n=1 Tax=Brachybacterium sp. GPGPB12 TaxID=3023517 RepID=UPI0031344812
MSQSPYARQSPSASSPLTARLYDLEYPRSLGVYSTYQEVQSVVDTLADHEFPVQSTLIVGTDLKLMERVTGRRTWPKVIGQGILSGLWMGLFLGSLFMLITPGDLMIVLSSVLMGIVFFTVWSVIGYAMTGGKRDFTSMTSTIPMQYEPLVEHKHADQARRILAESGAGPAVAPSPRPLRRHRRRRADASAPCPDAGRRAVRRSRTHAGRRAVRLPGRAAAVPGTAHPARSRAGSLRRVSPGSRVSARGTARHRSRGSAPLPSPGAARTRPVRRRARTARASGNRPAPRGARTPRRTACRTGRRPGTTGSPAPRRRMAARSRTAPRRRTARRRSAEPPDAPHLQSPRSTIRRPGALPSPVSGPRVSVSGPRDPACPSRGRRRGAPSPQLATVQPGPRPA